LCTHPLGLSSGLSLRYFVFRLYQTVSGSDFLGAFREFTFVSFPSGGFKLYQVFSGFPTEAFADMRNQSRG
ncbi:hypothetical protein, partial [Streptomyces sp. NPDC050504]|uniref:hypothetical protein n=1 Tax=Streptomyces sp. NPDC050504 TaxID=3365618 RepID=UPI00378F39DF